MDEVMCKNDRNFHEKNSNMKEMENEVIFCRQKDEAQMSELSQQKLSALTKQTPSSFNLKVMRQYLLSMI